MDEHIVCFRRYRFTKTGDDFVFMARGHVIVPNEPGWDSYFDVILRSLELTIMTPDIQLSPIDDGWFRVPYVAGKATFDSVKCELQSGIFEHGGCHARIISGPTFDEAVRAEVA